MIQKFSLSFREFINVCIIKFNAILFGFGSVQKKTKLIWYSMTDSESPKKKSIFSLNTVFYLIGKFK